MNIGHKIIVEGIDGAGKTTYINNLIKNNPDMNYEIVHCTRHTPNDFDYFYTILCSNKNIIFDRFMYGQFIYQAVEDRKLSIRELLELEDLIAEHGFEVIYVYSDIEACLINCKKDSEDCYYTYDYLKELDTKFRNFFDSTSTIEVTYYHNVYDYKNEDATNTSELTEEQKTEIVKNFDYSSLPKVVLVDFDETLFVGAKFPNIGKINEKLKYELLHGKYKDYKKVLFTHRTNGALVEACNACADEGIYFNAINENIKEVKEALFGGPTKIWFDVLIDDKAINPKDI